MEALQFLLSIISKVTVDISLQICAQSLEDHTWGRFLFSFFLKLMNELIYYYYFFNIYFWLCCVFVSVRGLSLVVASGGHSSSRCAGLSLSRPLLLPSTGSRRAGSVVVAHGPCSSAARGIFPDQGSNLCPLHWQADSQPLRHQGSPGEGFIGKEWNWCISLLLTFHWPDFGSLAIPDCRGGEEEERNTDFAQELAVLATGHM